jgi:hypothetical protein
MLHLHSAVRDTVPQKQRCDTADLNANWYDSIKSGTATQTKATGQCTVLKLFRYIIPFPISNITDSYSGTGFSKMWQ